MSYRRNVLRKTVKGQVLIDNQEQAFYQLERIQRQMLILADGHRTIEDIRALTINHQQDLIQEALRALLAQELLVLGPERTFAPLSVQALKASWDLVKDKEAFAKRLYQEQIAHDFPELLPLFANTDWEQQYKAFIKMINYIMAGISDDGTVKPGVEEAIHILGKRHATYHVQKADYEKVGASLITNFRRVLLEKFMQGMEDSWLQAFSFISQAMIQGTRLF